MKASTWQHLRIPFSLFLMPVFLFAWSVSSDINWLNTIIAFVAIHLFLYPASNGFNSYFDKDEKSIGGIEKPLPVSKELYWVSLLWDAVAVLLGLIVSGQFALMLFVYGLISKAYSHPAIRLKKHPIAGWLVVGFFQGFFTFWMSSVAITGSTFSAISAQSVLAPALLSTALLLGSYPMTQVYQHEEDSIRGDRTISIVLGVKGTFRFTLICFAFSGIGFLSYYYFFHSWIPAIIFIVTTFPVTSFFFSWMKKVMKNPQQADFKHTMKLNLISSLSFIALFLINGVYQHFLT